MGIGHQALLDVDVLSRPRVVAPWPALGNHDFSRKSIQDQSHVLGSSFSWSISRSSLSFVNLPGVVPCGSRRGGGGLQFFCRDFYRLDCAPPSTADIIGAHSSNVSLPYPNLYLF